MHQEQNKNILIIQSDTANIVQATTFLGKRDWVIRTCTRLQDAISAIAEAQPQFVMVSIDHHNKNIRSFIKILMQSFPNRVIVFAEKPHVLTYHYFNEIGSQYNIYPPVSGPAIERTLLSYYKAQLGPGDTKVRIFKGPQYNKIEKCEYYAYKPRDPLAPLAPALSTIKAKEILSIVEESASAKDVDNNIAPSSETSSFRKKQNVPVFESGEVTEKKEKTYDFGDVTAKKAKEFSLGDVEAKADNTDNGDVTTTDEEQKAGKVFATNESEATGEVKEAESAAAARFDLVTRDTTEVKFNLVHHQESLISRAAHEALEKTAIRSIVNHHEIELIEVASDMSCVVVESTRFSGYLLVALGKNKELDAAFMENLRQRLFQFLKSNGEELNEGDQPMKLTLQKVAFKKWAAAEADFLRQSIHNKDEVSIAFFPHRELRAHFEDSADEKMAKIKLADIVADVPVDFNLYLYLEENKRYIHYTKKGNALLSSQKARLERQGMMHMHVEKTDIPEFNRYHTQNFLNSKIENFHAELNTKAI
jgi:hypothetical protein